VLDSGLAVLSLAAGPVLGAFLSGVLSTRVKSRAMLAGMLLGTTAVTYAWATVACAWTWYAFLGASVTSLGAWLLSFVLADPPHVSAV
jgi:Na+/proline symporter